MSPEIVDIRQELADQLRPLPSFTKPQAQQQPSAGLPSFAKPQGQPEPTVSLPSFARPTAPQAPEPTGIWGGIQKGLEWWQEEVETPWAASLWRIGAQMTPWESRGEAEMREAEAQGAGWLGGATAGWTGVERPLWQTLPAEMSLPAYYLPIAGWMAKAGTLAGRGALAAGAGAKVAKGIETGARVPLMAEQALGRAIISPITGAKIPRTAAMRAAEIPAKKIPGLIEPVKWGIKRIAKPELDRMFQAYEGMGLGSYRAGADIVAEEGLAIPSVFKVMEQVMRPTYGKAFARQMSKIPTVGKPLQWELNLLDRRILMSSEVEARIMAENVRTASAARFMPQAANRLKALGDQWQIWGTRELTTPEGVLARNVKVDIIPEKVAQVDIGKMRADLSTLRNDIVRLEGFGQAPESELRRYMDDITEFFDRWLPDKKGQLLAARESLRVGDRSQFLIDTESLLSQGHLVSDAYERMLAQYKGVPKLSPYIDDILENYTKYDLNPQQLAWAKEYHAIRNEMLDLLKKEGVTDLEPFREILHAHRQGLGKMDEAGDLVMFGGFRGATGRVGAKNPIERIRVHPTQSEGVAANVAYNPDKIATLQSELTQMIKILRNSGIKDYILPKGLTPTQRIDSVLLQSYKSAVTDKKNADYVIKALQRVKRGEKLPSSTIKAIQRRAPYMADELVAGRKLSAEEISGLLSKARQVQTEATQALKGITPAYRRASRIARTGMYDPTRQAIINHPAFNGRIFDKEVAEAFRRGMGEQGERWATTAGAVAAPSRLLRAAIAALDFSAPFIQGLPVLGYNPAIWAKNTLRQFGWFFKRENLSKWMAKPEIQQEFNFWRKYGLYQGTFEYFAGVAGMERVGELVAGRVGRGAVRQTYGRGEIAFSGFGDAARIELARALRPLAKSEDDLFQIANEINKMTGVISPVSLGIPQVQQLVEQATLFAPRYLRAGFSLVSDIFRGGITGQIARESLGHFMAGGALIYYALCKATGTEPNFDPRSGRFMTITIGNQHIGIGAFMTSLMRFTADVATMSPEDLKFWPEAGEGPGEFATRLRRDNPFLRFMYTKASPLAGIATGLGLQQDFFGEEIESISDWARFVADNTLPIAMQALTAEGLEGEEYAQRLPAFGAEVMGMRTFPISAWEQAESLRERYAQADYDVPWEELNKLQQRELEERHADLAGIQAQAEEISAERFPEQAEVQSYLDELERVREGVYQPELWRLQESYDAGRLSGRDFREGVSQAGNALGMMYQHVAGNPDYVNAITALQTSGKQPAYKGDIAYNEYIATIVAATDLEDQWGEFDYGLYRQRIDDFRRRWGEDTWDYVQQRLAAGRDEPPLMAELRKAREVMRPYWEVRDSILTQYGLKEIDQQIRIMENTNPEQAKMMREHYGINRINQYVSQYRQYLRQTDSEIYKAWLTFYA